MENILTMVVKSFEPVLISKLKPELLEILKIADKDGASISAFELLKSEQLIDSSEISIHYDWLIEQYQSEEYERGLLEEIFNTE